MFSFVSSNTEFTAAEHVIIITCLYVNVTINFISLEAALDLEYEITRRYSGKYFEEEIRGLADASGASEKKIRRIHMIGELTLVNESFFSSPDPTL